MRVSGLFLVACFFALPTSALAGELPPANGIEGAAQPTAFAPGNLEKEMERGVADFLHSMQAVDPMAQTHRSRQSQPKSRSWIGRHPVLLGTLAGFGTGFIVGYANGNTSARNDPSSDYLTPEKKGLLWGGIGAGGGALLGWAIGAATR